MATATLAERKVPNTAPPRAPVVIEDKVVVPSGVQDLDSFRRWAKSDDFPERGRFSFLDGEIWVDLSMEQLFSHNGVKTEFTGVLRNVKAEDDRGYLFSDGVLLTHPGANLSTQADASFVLYESIESGRVKLVPGAAEGYVELEGSPDMMLEIVSPTTERKDKEILRELYWRARVAEYWLVDARQELSFQILRHSAKGYRKTRSANGWQWSAVFRRWFQLEEDSDPLDNPRYRLMVCTDDPRKSV